MGPLPETAFRAVSLSSWSRRVPESPLFEWFLKGRRKKTNTIMGWVPQETQDSSSRSDPSDGRHQARAQQRVAEANRQSGAVVFVFPAGKAGNLKQNGISVEFMDILV